MERLAPYGQERRAYHGIGNGFHKANDKETPGIALGASVLFIGDMMNDDGQELIDMAVQSALGELRDKNALGRMKMLKQASRSLDRVNRGQGNAIDQKILDEIYRMMF